MIVVLRPRDTSHEEIQGQRQHGVAGYGPRHRACCELTQFSCCIEITGLQGVLCDLLQDIRLRCQCVAKGKLNAVIPVDSHGPPADSDAVMQVPVAGFSTSDRFPWLMEPKGSCRFEARCSLCCKDGKPCYIAWLVRSAASVATLLVWIRNPSS
jgi:hypothetical protein